MKKYLYVVLLVGMVMGQSSQYIKTQKLIAKNDKLFELFSESMELSTILVKTANKETGVNKEAVMVVLEQYYTYKDDFMELYDYMINLKIYSNFYDIIANCEGDNSYADKLFDNNIETIEEIIDFEQGNNWKATHTKDSGVLMWYNSYLEYISELKLLL